MKTVYDAIVIGAGHAGVEAALALARMGHNTLIVTLSLDAISLLACNPSIGGTAKGHLVREVDALGGQMAISADKTYLQLKMLNKGKGSAVQSLRAQTDKVLYHHEIKNVLENQPNLTLLQSEVSEILIKNKKLQGVKTSLGKVYSAPCVILATGVYLNSSVVIGEFKAQSGPSGFQGASFLTNSLIDLGLPIRRFKTGTPARIKRSSVDFSKFSVEYGDDIIYGFSFLTKDSKTVKNVPCYLGYTNEKTKKIVLDNIHRSPLYNGSIKSVGPRYCPSFEDKIMKFPDKERHQIFLEPESSFTQELYVQGLSSSLPFDVQEQMYRSVAGFENIEIMRYAYAIEYDCVDPLSLASTLQYKEIEGLFLAGQINGSSGYEEAAAQGLLAGINASLYLRDKPLISIRRDEAYLGVLVDDLVVKGTNEPYRMMTARSEYRLTLRQENADLRLTEIGRQVGLVDDYRYEVFLQKKKALEFARSLLETVVSPKVFGPLFDLKGESYRTAGLTYKEILKRTNIKAADVYSFFSTFKNIPLRVLEEVEVEVKYEGYLKKQNKFLEESKKLEGKKLSPLLDYSKIKGLRVEAQQKLNDIKPLNLDQASRISGVSPSDITVLLIYLEKRQKNNV